MQPPKGVPFLDLGRSVSGPREGPIADSMQRVMRSGRWVLGPEVEAFEDEYAEWLGCPHVVGVGSGTDAIELALRALDIGVGDEVVTQANTCVPTVAAIERSGASPVLCDVRADDGTMDPTSLGAVIGGRTKAIIPVHLYGQCADVAAIARVAGRIPIVEDCAQAHGARFHGRMAGTMGTLGAFSFYPTKNLGALGDGGAVATSDPTLAKRLRMLRQYGQSERDNYLLSGVNSRLDEIQAAVLRTRLATLDSDNTRRRKIADAYIDALKGAVRPLSQRPECDHVFHLFVCLAPDRAAFRRGLQRRGIGTMVHYPRPIHKHDPYRVLGLGPASLETAELLAGQVVSLPMYPELSDAEVELVGESLESETAQSD